MKSLSVSVLLMLVALAGLIMQTKSDIERLSSESKENSEAIRLLTKHVDEQDRFTQSQDRRIQSLWNRVYPGSKDVTVSLQGVGGKGDAHGR